MPGLRKHFKKIAAGIEAGYDELALSLRKRLDADDPLQIVTYRTYGTLNKLHVKGRVLKDKGIRESKGSDSLWNNLLNMYKRFESDEVPNAELNVSLRNRNYTTTTDKEGYFSTHISTEVPLQWEDMWQDVDMSVINAPFGLHKSIRATANVLVPSPEAEYGIISDIDDTVIKTNATSLLAMSRNTFFHNAHTRMPFPGVTEFYRSLQLGRNGKRNNPFFYVSSSPWNLYDLLIDFLDLNEIPEGPLLLRDFGLNQNEQMSDHMGHKFKEIKNILQTYPHLPFVLIGDSGQDDPKIYREVVAQFPGRILAVYIRDVQLKEREKIAIDISKTLADEKVEMVIVDNTVEAAEHAAKAGLIFQESISQIETDKKLDKGELDGKETLTI
jgi:phosphatidate phosphatase APP1